MSFIAKPVTGWQHFVINRAPGSDPVKAYTENSKMLADKFGVSWQIVPKIIGALMTDPEKGPRAMQALMKMKKLDIAVLQNA